MENFYRGDGGLLKAIYWSDDHHHQRHNHNRLRQGVKPATKQLLKLKRTEPSKELLEYRGSKNTRERRSPKGDKMSVSSNDSFDDNFNQTPFCNVCFLMECQRRTAVGLEGPHHSESGPWNGHSPKDEHNRITCPLLYFLPSDQLAALYQQSG